MGSSWSERSEPSSFVVELEGIDVARRDAAELIRFESDVRVPTEGTSPGARLSWPALVAALLASWLVIGPERLLPALLLVAMSLVYLAVWYGKEQRFDFEKVKRHVRERLQFSAPSDLARFTDRFTVTVDSMALTVTGAKPGASNVSVPLSELVEIRGGRRVVLHVADGSARELPCSLLDLSQHGALAARLDETVRRMRAGAGYRGGRIDAEAEWSDEPDAATRNFHAR